MQQRFHSVKENARRSATIGAAFITPSRAIKGGRGKGEFCKEVSPALLFFLLSSQWLQPSLFSSRTRALFINVKHLHARVPHCTIYAFRLWERESGKHCVRGDRGCRLGPSSQQLPVAGRKATTKNLTASIHPPKQRFSGWDVPFLTREGEEGWDKISRWDISLPSLREDTSVELIF